MKNDIYSKEHKFLIQQLKNAREVSNLSQKEVAELLDKTQSYVSKVEAGQCRIDVIQLQEFAKIYKKRMSFLLNSHI